MKLVNMLMDELSCGRDNFADLSHDRQIEIATMVLESMSPADVGVMLAEDVSDDMAVKLILNTLTDDERDHMLTTLPTMLSRIESAYDRAHEVLAQECDI